MGGKLQAPISHSVPGIFPVVLIAPIMRFVIPVVFYEITNVQCVYSSNITIFISRI